MNIKKLLTASVSVLLCTAVLAGCAKDGGDTPNSGGQVNSIPTVRDGAAYINTDWSYGQVAAGGGGFVSGVFATPEQDVYYAKTDVGGAYYRTPNTGGKWVSMNYWVTASDRGYQGCDGLAFDPQSPNRVFLLLGTEYFSDGRTVVAVSDDYGENLSIVDVTDKIKVHGNGMGRGNGERIAVDPNNGSIIFAGGRNGVLIKSTDGGASWETVGSFPDVTTPNANGINGILFDPSSEKDGVTQKIYVSVSRAGDGSIFVSEDGGASWAAMSNADTTYMPLRMRLDGSGNLYVCYADHEGPWNASQGAVFRYGTDGSAENIAPSGQSFGDIIIDPNDGNKLILTTTNVYEAQPNGSYGDAFYTSADGGKTWHNVLDSMEIDVNGMPWVEGCAIHWCSCLALDPFDTNKIMVNSGNGIFSCANIWDGTPKFYFDALGIEETVPLDIITMKDYPLISAAGDYDGFVHEDIFTPASRHKDMIGTTTSITIAAQNRDYWAKVGGSDSEMRLTYSTDGGNTWNFITNSPESGKTFKEGRIALNADGSVLLWSPGNGMKIYRTENWGETWEEVSGVIGSDIYIIGDPNNANYFYSATGGSFAVSSDGGRTFKKTPSLAPSYKRLCVDPEHEGTVYIPNGAGLYVTKDYGETAELVPGLKYCEAVGLGKAKNEGDPLVIYVWGTPMDSDTEGIYMSENNGESWVRVNDDIHNFGGTGNGVFVSGDMNVYGRCYMSTVGLGIIYCDKNDK
ncbi:MAG: hypothetical protein NC253_05785 [Ruminococcus sp.]|nr:hypothetical protein [Ruminococcus sp.]MCM1380871.1 hypothetical protein [Muribaculaceae bacterium]MCM1479612.1 hypothetical protein [Muribaculaceae bacterium]